MLTTIPFTGFYESDHSGLIDNAVESYYSDADGIPVPDSVPDDFNYGALRVPYAKIYTQEFTELLTRAGVPTAGLEFESMQSPKYYNYTTDRIFCNVPESTVQLWYKMSVADKHAMLSKVITDQFTSRNGFSSGYSNDITAWLSKPLSQWDHNEIGALLEAVMLINCIQEDDDRLNAWEIMEEPRGNGFFDNIITAAEVQK